MKRIKAINLIFLLTCCLFLNAQRVELNGQLIADDDIEGIHILNKTASKYDVSTETGKFVILAKTNDTLIVSGLKYEIKEVIVSDSNVSSGSLRIQLKEKINELRPVVIGKILTGSLLSDIENSDAKTETNFYDLGIPGSTKIPMTQNERKLFDADAGPIASIMGGPFGGGMGVNFHKLLNTISGRTKRLKAIVNLDNKDKCANRLRREYGMNLFEKDSLNDNLITEFFLFAQEDIRFLPICSRNNDIEAIDYLKEKLKVYKSRRETNAKN